MSNPFSYDAKRVVVTGGATGVGAALIEVLEELGAADVTVLDIKAPSGPHSRFIEVDLSDQKVLDTAIAAIDGPIHALFNNAGVADTLPPRTVLAVNWLALRRLSEGLLPKIAPGGAIANTASIAGGQWATRLPQISELMAIEGWDQALDWYEGQSDLGIDTYSFTKECVQVYTMKSSHATQARDVRTNSVCPAPIDTPLLIDFRKTMTDAIIDWTISQANGRAVSPREVALVLAFLASEAASYVNGVNLNVDAGFMSAMTTGQVDLTSIPR